MNEPVKPAAASALEKREATAVEYVPYGASDKIKMTISIVQNLIAVKTKTGKTCSDRDAIKFLAMCQAKRLNPFEGDAFLIGYDNRDGTATFALITAHQTYLKRAELHPEFDGMKSGIIVKDEDGSSKDLEGDYFDEGQKVVGGWATVFFKNRKQPMHKRLRLSRFQKPFGVWQEDPAGMICKCAEADALRSSFPTMLGGLYMREEIEIEKPPQMSRPDFSGSEKPLFENGGRMRELIAETKAAEEKPKAEPQSGATDEAAGVSTQDSSAASSDDESNPELIPVPPVKALRELCKAAGVKEGKILEFLADLNATDGSVGSLEELQLQFPELVARVLQDWGDISARILAVQKGGRK